MTDADAAADHSYHVDFVAGCPFCEGERDRPVVDLDEIEAIAGMGVRYRDEEK